MSLVYPLLPCILGATLALLISNLRNVRRPGLMTLYAGIGGLAGYLVIALFIYVGNSFGILVFRVSYLYALGAMECVAIAALVWATCRRSGTKITLPHVGIFPSLCLISLCFYQVLLLPVSGWDALGLWTGWAADYINFDQLRSTGEVFERTHPRHPMTIVSLAAFSGFAASQGYLGLGSLLAWWAVWVCGAMMIFGAVRAISEKRGLAYIALYGFLSLPLLENHVLLAGYADLWVAVSVTAAAALIAVSFAHGGAGNLLMGMLFALVPLVLKNTGVLYTTAVLLPLLILVMSTRFPKLLAVGAIFGLCAILWVAVFGFDLMIFGKRFAVVWGEKSTAVFGGYSMPFALFPIHRIVYNNIWAFFVNQSFALIGLVAIASTGIALFGRNNFDLNRYRAFQFVLLVGISLVGAFMLPQLVVQYAERFAVPASDLGNSRFLLALPPVVLISLAFWGLPTAKSRRTIERLQNSLEASVT